MVLMPLSQQRWLNLANYTLGDMKRREKNSGFSLLGCYGGGERAIHPFAAIKSSICCYSQWFSPWV
jgi:hypothetical protein